MTVAEDGRCYGPGINKEIEMRLHDELILREVAGEAMLIPVGDTALRLHGMIMLTETGKFLCEKLAAETTEEELREALVDEYDIDEETARNDVREFLESLREKEALVG